MDIEKDKSTDTRPNKQPLTDRHRSLLKEIIEKLDLFGGKTPYITTDDRYYYFPWLQSRSIYDDYLSNVVSKDISIDAMLTTILSTLDDVDLDPNTIELCYAQFACLIWNNPSINAFVANSHKEYEIARLFEDIDLSDHSDAR